MLGIILFLLDIKYNSSDLCELLSLKLYYDDAKLDSSIHCLDDSTVLHTDMNSITSWPKTWQLLLVIIKYSLLHVGAGAYFVIPYALVLCRFVIKYYYYYYYYYYY